MDAGSFNRYPGKGGGSVTKALFHPLEPLPFGRWKAAQKKGAVFFEKGREHFLSSRLSLEPLPPGGSGRLLRKEIKAHEASHNGAAVGVGDPVSDAVSPLGERYREAVGALPGAHPVGREDEGPDCVFQWHRKKFWTLDSGSFLGTATGDHRYRSEVEKVDKD